MRIDDAGRYQHAGGVVGNRRWAERADWANGGNSTPRNTQITNHAGRARAVDDGAVGDDFVEHFPSESDVRHGLKRTLD